MLCPVSDWVEHFCYTLVMQILIGIDEVGRGSIAGPVSVGSFSLLQSREKSFIQKVKKHGLKFADSKKLTKQQRDLWYAFLLEAKQKKLCDFNVEHVSNTYIDEKGISRAISAAIKKIVTPHLLYAQKCEVALDGGLRAPSAFKKQKTIIKGDEKIFVIMCASIVAKVRRDTLMKKESLRFPLYGFEQHVGYGTKIHFARIKEHGPSPIHRKSFLKSLPLE